MVFLKSKPTEKVVGEILKEFSDIEGLKEIVNGILALQDSEIYEKLIFLSFDSLVDSKAKINRDEDKFSQLEELAIENLSKFSLNIPFTPLIGVNDFLVVYSFIAGNYYINLGRKLNLEDRNKVFHSDIAIKLLLMLEDFDSNQKHQNLRQNSLKG